MPQLTIKFTW